MADQFPRFPLFMDISHWRVLVVGGGSIAERRVKTLLKFGPYICVVSPQATDGLKELAEQGKIELSLQEFSTCAINKARWNMVLAVTDDPEFNSIIYKASKAQFLLVNNASDHEQCDFYFPAIMEGPGIVAGMTSGGEDHARVKKLAAEIREVLNRGEEE